MHRSPLGRRSPDSASLSDSLSSSELELLEALAWPGPGPGAAGGGGGGGSSSSSSAGVLRRAGGGCFSRSWRQIFSLLLIREIEVLWRGQDGAHQTHKNSDMQEPISEGSHSMCSQLERATEREPTHEWTSGSLIA